MAPAVRYGLKLLITTFFVTLLFPSSADSKIASGVLVTTNEIQNWQFLTRFCFLSRAGRLEFEFSYPTRYDEGINAAQNILLYHDIQWPNVYPTEQRLRQRKELTCEERESYLLPENNQVINLTTRYRWSGCSIVERFGEPWYHCRGGRTFSSTRERWWYVVVDNCATTQGLYLNYSITMTNSLSDKFFFKHFSADEFYILQMTIGFILVYLLLMILSIHVAYSLHIRQLYHTTFKLYISSVSIHFLGLIAQLVFWANYGITGVPKLSYKNCGRFCEFTGQIIFLILLILMAKGYTITRGRISTGGVIKIIVLSLLFICLTIGMFGWEVASFDPALVLYIYDSIPGYAMIGMRIASWLWFLYAIFFTLKHYPEKLGFYLVFVVFYSLWFWVGTAVALAAIDTIPRWMKEKVVQGCVLFITFLGHLIFLILTWPTVANKTFPYHIKTTQVGVMNPNAQPVASNGNVPAGGGAYSPATGDTYEPIGERKFIDMFTTDRSSRSNQPKLVDPDKFPHEAPDSYVNRVN